MTSPFNQVKKYCPACETTKPVDAFYYSRRYGLQANCKSCQSERFKKWYHEKVKAGKFDVAPEPPAPPSTPLRTYPAAHRTTPLPPKPSGLLTWRWKNPESRRVVTAWAREMSKTMSNRQIGALLGFGASTASRIIRGNEWRGPVLAPQEKLNGREEVKKMAYRNIGGWVPVVDVAVESGRTGSTVLTVVQRQKLATKKELVKARGDGRLTLHYMMKEEDVPKLLETLSTLRRYGPGARGGKPLAKSPSGLVPAPRKSAKPDVPEVAVAAELSEGAQLVKTLKTLKTLCDKMGIKLEDLHFENGEARFPRVKQEVVRL